MRSFTHRLLSFLDKIISVSGPSLGYRVGDTDCPRVLAPGLVDKWTLLKGRGWPPKACLPFEGSQAFVSTSGEKSNDFSGRSQIYSILSQPWLLNSSPHC